MANPVCEVLLTDSELEPSADCVDASAGAFLDFWGVVRLQEGAREIHGLDYETHSSMAEHQLRVLGHEAIERFGLNRVIIRHRVGFIPVGKASLFVRITALHRAEAFQAMEWLVDELKKRVPIWKRPKFKVEQTRENESAKVGQAILHQ